MESYGEHDVPTFSRHGPSPLRRLVRRRELHHRLQRRQAGRPGLEGILLRLGQQQG